jgi:peroxin-5
VQRATAEDYRAVQATDVEAWSLLGRTHAMNEKEEKALSAFQQGQRALEGEDAGREKVAGEMLTVSSACSPPRPQNVSVSSCPSGRFALTTLKNLAISYVNESLDLAALTTLHQFLRIVHPSHAGPAPSRSALTETSSPWALHQGVTNSFLNLAREQYASSGTVDPDVQVGLGTLYYMMGEYGEARDCWVAALGERPDVSYSNS